MKESVHVLLVVRMPDFVCQLLLYVVEAGRVAGGGGDDAGGELGGRSSNGEQRKRGSRGGAPGVLRQ